LAVKRNWLTRNLQIVTTIIIATCTRFSILRIARTTSSIFKNGPKMSYNYNCSITKDALSIKWPKRFSIFEVTS